MALKRSKEEQIWTDLKKREKDWKGTDFMKIERKEIRTDLKRRWENGVDVVVFRMDFMKSGRKDR